VQHKLIAIIGGSGFIGTRLAETLRSRGFAFRIIDKRVSETFPQATILADVTKEETLAPALAGCDVIINLAAEHRDDVFPRSLYDAVNVDGARNVCQAASNSGVKRIIFTSSVAVYGFVSRETGENGRIAPFNDYGRTKYAAEQVYGSWQEQDPAGRSLVIVRPTVVFGERNRGNVFNLLQQIARRRFVMIGSGQNRKSMAYVGNVAAFIAHMLDADPGVHVSNYVDKPDMTMQELVNLAHRTMSIRNRLPIRVPYPVGYVVGLGCDVFARVSGKKLPVSRIRVKKFCSGTQFGSAAASYGFAQPVELREAIVRTIRAEFLGGAVDGPLFYSE
jgi:nucleoside-diphosphate-sugar epimerase